MAEELERLGIKTTGSHGIERVVRRFYPHSIGHFLGAPRPLLFSFARYNIEW